MCVCVVAVVIRHRSKAETQMQELEYSTDEGSHDFINRKMELQHAGKLHMFMETKLQDAVLVEEDKDSRRHLHQSFHRSSL